MINMLKIKSLFLSLLALISGSGLYAQEMGNYYIQQFTPREYKASSANYAAVQDHRGILYAGNSRGVLEYDGASWRLIPLNGKGSAWAVARDSAGSVYVGGLGDFGYLRPDQRGVLYYQSLKGFLPQDKLEFSAGVRVLGTHQGAYFHVYDSRSLYHWNGTQLTQIDNYYGRPGSVLYMYAWNNLWRIGPEGVRIYQGGAWVPVEQEPGSLSESLALAAPFGTRSLLSCTYEGALQLLDFSGSTLVVRKFRTEADGELAANQISSLIPLRNGQMVIGTVKGGAYIISPGGRLIRRLNQQNGLLDNLIMGGIQDHEGSLWLLLSKGISRVEMASPLTHLGESSGLQGIVITAARHQGVLYATTPLGVFYQDQDRFYPVQGIDAECWQLTEVPDGSRTRLIAATVKGLFEIQGRYARPIADKKWYTRLLPSTRYPGRVYVISAYTGVFMMTLSGGQWSRLIPLDLLKGRFRDIVETPAGDLWLTDVLSKGSALRVSVGSAAPIVQEVVRYDSLRGLPPINTISLVGGEPWFATDQGIYLFDPGSDSFELHPALGSGTGVTHLVEDPSGGLWLERQTDIRRWFEWARRQPDGSWVRDSVMLSALSDAELWGSIYPEASGVTWICTPEGLYAYNTLLAHTQGRSPQAPLIRRVTVAPDSVIYGGYCTDALGNCPDSLRQGGLAPVISYATNSVTLHWSTPYFGQETGTRYSFYLAGWDTQWSPWTEERKKDYTLLPPGSYTFMVKARNTYNQESPVARFAFVIRPPWYRSPWAFITYALLAVGVVYSTVKLNTRRLYNQNEHLERLVYERTTEIWEQHKEIVKKTVALKRQKEEIATQHDLLEQKNDELTQAMHQLQMAQSHLITTEKMASLGQLTAGIAHEINNPINYVRGNVGPLKRDFEEIRTLFEHLTALRNLPNPTPEVQKLLAYAEEIEADELFKEMDLLLKGIEEGATRTREIVEGLKIFSRSDQDTFKHADLHAGLNATLRLLKNKLKDRIAVVTDLDDALPSIECLPGKLNQVFMNIMTNAIDAIEARATQRPETVQDGILGQLTIRTDFGKGCLPHHTDCVRVFIKDNGEGMPAEVREHIFEPFFTTKDVGQGTGLGLAITFGIVEKHQGTISVESEPGKGTTFIITLPIRQQTDEALTSESLSS
ncbi:MAG: ATP-binding protein [Bacteroidia bacterium]|nr:ATP-binding protein [Bacteroidia bacterium]